MTAVPRNLEGACQERYVIVDHWAASRSRDSRLRASLWGSYTSSAHASMSTIDDLVNDKHTDGLVSLDDISATSEDDYDLPQLQPLSHDNPYLSTTNFNVEDFLLSRSHTSLPDLRSELREYLAALKEELVGLINDDYEAFISLSTDLQEEGDRLERMKLPSAEMNSIILVRTCALLSQAYLIFLMSGSPNRVTKYARQH